MDTDTRGRLFGCVFPLAVIMLIFANRVLICTSSFRLKYSTHVCYFAHWAKQLFKNNSCLKTKGYICMTFDNKLATFVAIYSCIIFGKNKIFFQADLAIISG